MKKNKLNKLTPLILVIALMLISITPTDAATALCSGSSVICDNGETPFCSNTGGFPVCQTGLYNGPPCCDYSNNGLPCGRYEPIDSPQCPASPPPPVIIVAPPTIPTTSTCNASALFLICNTQGTSANFVSCSCNPLSTPSTPIINLPTSSTNCAAGLTACPNNTTPGANCCQYGCCPSIPSRCKCSNSNQCDINCTVQPVPSIPTTSPTITLSGPDRVFLSSKGRTIKNYSLSGSGFSSPSICSSTLSISGLSTMIEPTYFTLSSTIKTQTITLTIPRVDASVLKKASSLTIKINCSNGVSVDKLIKIKIR